MVCRVSERIGYQMPIACSCMRGWHAGAGWLGPSSKFADTALESVDSLAATSRTTEPVALSQRLCLPYAARLDSFAAQGRPFRSFCQVAGGEVNSIFISRGISPRFPPLHRTQGWAPSAVVAHTKSRVGHPPFEPFQLQQVAEAFVVRA